MYFEDLVRKVTRQILNWQNPFFWWETHIGETCVTIYACLSSLSYDSNKNCD